jgi:hypothetical protein
LRVRALRRAPEASLHAALLLCRCFEHCGAARFVTWRNRLAMAAPLTQRQVRTVFVLLIAADAVLTRHVPHARRRQTLIKFFGFAVGILVAPVLVQYRGLEGAAVLRVLRAVRHDCGDAPAVQQPVQAR